MKMCFQPKITGSKLLIAKTHTFLFSKYLLTLDHSFLLVYFQVKAVLEAVSILLSDRLSRFVCLIAVDSRIAVKSIEEGMGDALGRANISGQEYLKKIINLPFCLPEVIHFAI